MKWNIGRTEAEENRFRYSISNTDAAMTFQAPAEGPSFRRQTMHATPRLSWQQQEDRHRRRQDRRIATMGLEA